jgi:hypothetical protein
MLKSDELIGTAEYLILEARCRVKRCRYNRVLLYLFYDDISNCSGFKVSVVDESNLRNGALGK